MIDTLTGLMWPRNGNLPNGTRTWYAALDYVATLNSSGGLCGHTDWRLPNINELETLVNANEPNTSTWLMTQGFISVQAAWYWSSSTNAGYAGFAWIVDMWYGLVVNHGKDGYGYVWPVRAGQAGPLVPSAIWHTGQTKCYDAQGTEIPCAGTGQDGDIQAGVAWPSPRFTDNTNGTVADTLTGLMWTKDAHAPGPAACTTHTYKTWKGALDHVQCLNTNAYLGYRDWRLPNRKELMSLIDRSRYDPALPTGHPFTNVQADWYWSSSTYAYYTNYAWIVYMWDGSVSSYSKDISSYVWPVRAGQGRSFYTLALSAGWNLPSLPFQPTDTSMEKVLSEIAGKYSMVWGYQNQQWKFYNPSNASGSTLKSIAAGQGYWIKGTAPQTLTVAGQAPGSLSIALEKGWNLVGYNKTVHGSPSTILSSIANKYSIVWAYIGGAWKYYDPMDDLGSTLKTFEPGYGYWIKAKEAVEWAVP
jgi:hypothetical protein